MEKPSDRDEKLCLNFAQKCVKNPKKNKYTFPKNSKPHGMITRNPETFYVKHYLNDRLQNSHIIYMQLNTHKS